VTRSYPARDVPDSVPPDTKPITGYLVLLDGSRWRDSQRRQPLRSVLKPRQPVGIVREGLLGEELRAGRGGDRALSPWSVVRQIMGPSAERLARLSSLDHQKSLTVWGDVEIVRIRSFEELGRR
jgi:hypothetical protein